MIDASRLYCMRCLEPLAPADKAFCYECDADLQQIAIANAIRLLRNPYARAYSILYLESNGFVVEELRNEGGWKVSRDNERFDGGN